MNFKQKAEAGGKNLKKIMFKAFSNEENYKPKQQNELQ
jgi:hypothetical protein